MPNYATGGPVQPSPSSSDSVPVALDTDCYWAPEQSGGSFTGGSARDCAERLLRMVYDQIARWLGLGPWSNDLLGVLVDDLAEALTDTWNAVAVMADGTVIATDAAAPTTEES